MLNIGKLVRDQADFYLDAVARSQEEYYTGAGEAPGYWLGGGAAELGLAGRVSEQGLRWMLDGAHPQTGGELAAGRVGCGPSIAAAVVGAPTPAPTPAPRPARTIDVAQASEPASPTLPAVARQAWPARLAGCGAVPPVAAGSSVFLALFLAFMPDLSLVVALALGLGRPARSAQPPRTARRAAGAGGVRHGARHRERYRLRGRHWRWPGTAGWGARRWS